MKQQKWRVLLSLLLAMCFCLSAFAPVYAADGLWGGFGQSPDGSLSESLSDSWKKLWNRLFGGDNGTQDDSGVETYDTTTPYRIVMLDCGRKYFSVENIKKLINTMAKYGYNQLQLSFGNGGCRFLLNNMDLSYGNFTMYGDTVTKNIKAGNKAFNGDESYLTEDEMTAIITYANAKNIEIVPMLNMPGHMEAILYSFSSYKDANGNLNISKTEVCNFAYALLSKYVEYFQSKGCKYFHFGADESKHSGAEMAAFLSGCAEIITHAGMIPRAFNDATNEYKNNNISYATMPKNVQITYWHKEDGSQSAFALATAGYSLINTHGRWYYVIKTAQSDSAGTKYWNGSPNDTAVSVELPTLKLTHDGGKWVDKDVFFDGDGDSIRAGSEVSSNLGTMFCIWCDASSDDYLTDSDVISENENYGALYQIEKLAENYWPDDIKKGGETTAPTVTLEDGKELPTSITKDGTLNLKANKSVTWITSNSAVIDLLNPANSESITGTTVTAVAKDVGIATITVTDEDGNTASYTITVKAADSGSETEKTVELKVGETATFDVADGTEAKGYISGDKAYIATAVVAEGVAQAAELKKVTAIESGKTYLIYNNRKKALLTTTPTTDWDGNYSGLLLSGTADVENAGDLNKWVITGANNSYTVKAAAGYLTIGANTASATTAETTITLKYNTTGGYWNISYNGYYLNHLGSSSQAGGWNNSSAPTDEGSKWTLYEIGGNTLTITGTGEGETTVTVGNVTYNITVTAPSKTEDIALTYGTSQTLPANATATVKSGNNYVTIENGKIVAGTESGNAVVEVVTTNGGGKVTSRITYNITVSDIDFSKISPLPVQLWITNTWVGANSAPTSLQTVEIAAKDAYKEEGVLLGNFVPSPAYKKDGGTVQVVYWKGVILSDGTVPEQQGADYSNSGVDFARVRYWNNEWQYLKGFEWVTIDTSAGKDTVIAYYLQINEVADEITTGSQHYGNPPISDPGVSTYGFTLTAFAVVYPDGSLSRTEAEMYKTGMIRGFYDNLSCDLGTIYAENNSTYKISKMTVTWGKHVDGYGSSISWTNMTGTYGTNWGVVWNKKTNSAGEEWYDETTYWKSGDSDVPMINDSTLKFEYGETKPNAALILIYLEVVETDNTLNIVYWDDNADKQITTNPMPIPVVVKPNVTFLNIQQESDDVNIGSFTLGDDAYIVNSSGAKQGFNKEISKVPGVTGVYLSGMYQYVSAEISEDGMTLKLHFNLKKPDQQNTYVVDFGLKVEILPSDFEIENVETIESISLERGTLETTTPTTDKEGTYGRAIIAKDKLKVTYELKHVLQGQVTIPLYVMFTDGRIELFQAHILPASNVLYEESFFTPTTGWITEGTADTTRTQQAAKLGDVANNSASVYGYDSAYAGDSKFSGGSALRAEVKVSSTDVTAPASFTFTGTGFDIISECGLKTGMLFVRVTQDGNYVKSYLVDTYFKGDTQNIMTEGTMTYQIPVVRNTELPHGTYTVTVYGALYRSSGAVKNSAAANAVYGLDAVNNDADGLYAMLAQLGVSDEELSNLEFVYMDENSVLNGGSGAQPVYDSEISLFSTYANEETDSQYYVYLDGFRVYNPLGLKEGGTSDQYEVDKESGFVYTPVLGMLDVGNIGSNENITNCFYVEGDGSKEVTTENITNYQKKGPQNEVYLAPNTAIAFRLDNTSVNSIQISAKAVDGNAIVKADGTISGNPVMNDKAISTCTEMYYTIIKSGEYFVVTNTGDGVLSISELKGPVNTTTQALTEEDKQDAIDAINAVLFSAPVDPVDPEPEPEPETFEPQLLKAYAPAVALRRWGATITVTSSIEEGMEVYIRDENGESMKLTPNNTRMVRWGLADTYRYSFNTGRLAAGTHTYYVYAVKDGLESAPVAVTFTVW